jgi:DNA-binding MarR family transcriptional regulator
MTPRDKRVIDDVEALAQAADRLFYAMRRSRTAIGNRAADGLSLAQLALLDPLAEDTDAAGLPVSRLAAGAEVSVPTATRMLQQLEAKGLITRHRSPDDERKVLIRLTAEGAHRLRALRTELRARQFEALSRYSTQERRELTAQLRGLADVIGGSMTGPSR